MRGAHKISAKGAGGRGDFQTKAHSDWLSGERVESLACDTKTRKLGSVDFNVMMAIIVLKTRMAFYLYSRLPIKWWW